MCKFGCLNQPLEPSVRTDRISSSSNLDTRLIQQNLESDGDIEIINKKDNNNNNNSNNNNNKNINNNVVAGKNSAIPDSMETDSKMVTLRDTRDSVEGNIDMFCDIINDNNKNNNKNNNINGNFNNNNDNISNINNEKDKINQCIDENIVKIDLSQKTIEIRLIDGLKSFKVKHTPFMYHVRIRFQCLSTC